MLSKQAIIDNFYINYNSIPKTTNQFMENFWFNSQLLVECKVYAEVLEDDKMLQQVYDIYKAI